MRDFLRTLFGVRKKRRPFPSGPRPGVGAVIVRRELCMKVTQAIEPELWEWLMLSGWRVNAMRNERRRFVSLPTTALSLLIAAGADKRAKVHANLINEASIGRR